MSMNPKGDVFIRGEGINLRALRQADLDGNWFSWFNDPEVNLYQNKGFYPNTREKQAVFFDSLRNDERQVTLAIETEAEGTHIGNVTLKGIDWIHRSAELGIVIGEKGQWGRGYGRQAWWLMTKYGFLVLNLNRISAHMIKENVRSLRTAQRSGFLIEGELQEYYFKNGSYHNVIMTGTTARRWNACFGTDPALRFSESRDPAPEIRPRA